MPASPERDLREVFRTTPELDERKETGQDWYPPNHFRPLVDWRLDETESEEFRAWVLGPLFQMTSLMLHEKRSHLSHINAIGELCAQFRRGILAMMRDLRADEVIRTVSAYHRLHPRLPGNRGSRRSSDRSIRQNGSSSTSTPSTTEPWGIVTISRESYSNDVDRELNRALDWLKSAGIDRVVVTGDFHLSTQMIGADTSAFYPALDNVEEGLRIAGDWSRTARRLNQDFAVSVGFVPASVASEGSSNYSFTATTSWPRSRPRWECPR